MIVLEGPDLVGKTTLAKLLAESLDLKYQHYSRLPDDFHRYFDYLPSIKPAAILDRFHMSEIVYAKARGDSEYRTNPVWYTAIDREILRNGGIIVLITADEDVIRERYEARKEEEMYDIDLVLRANQFFQVANQGELDEFYPFTTLHFHCTQEKPFLDEHDIELIVTAHQLSLNEKAFLRFTNEYPRPAKA